MVKDRIDASYEDGSPETPVSPISPVSTRPSDDLVEHYYTTQNLKDGVDKYQRQWGIENRSQVTRWLLAEGLKVAAKGKRPTIRTVQIISEEKQVRTKP